MRVHMSVYMYICLFLFVYFKYCSGMKVLFAEKNTKKRGHEVQ